MVDATDKHVLSHNAVNATIQCVLITSEQFRGLDPVIHSLILCVIVVMACEVLEGFFDITILGIIWMVQLEVLFEILEVGGDLVTAKRTLVARRGVHRTSIFPSIVGP